MRSLSVLIAVGVVLCGCPLFAAGAPAAEVAIFKGEDPALDGIVPANWGGGSAAKSKERVLDGSWSIKFTTQGLYSGGRLDFQRPVSLFSGGVDKTRYIQFAFFLPDSKVVNPTAGTNYWDEIEPYTMPTVNKLRFVLESDDGVTVSAEEPTVPLDPDDNWMRCAVPLVKLKLTDDVTEFRLKRLVITTDVPATLYLGEMRLVTDANPIKVEPLETQSPMIGEDVIWAAKADGGMSSLKYSWDFDARNGVQEETVGMVGRYVYTIGGTFTVTLTVTDLDGLKAPVILTSTVEIMD